MAQAELAVDIFDHDDRAVNDDAEVDGADGEQVGGFAGSVKKDEGEEKSERNGKCGNDRSADAYEEKDKDNENEHHAAYEIPFDGVGGHFDEIAAVIVGANFDVGRKKIAIDLDGFFLDTLKDVLRLFAAAHEDDAFDGVVIVFPFVLKAENAKARSVADDHAADVFHANWGAIAAANDDFADIFGCFNQAETADVVELAALRVEAAAGVGVVCVIALKT